jgi:hypothetical protein
VEAAGGDRVDHVAGVDWRVAVHHWDEDALAAGDALLRACRCREEGFDPFSLPDWLDPALVDRRCR